MLTVALVLVVVTPALLGLGLLLRAGLSRIPALRIHPNVGETGMLGCLAASLLGTIVHFFVPLSPTVAVVVIGTGLATVARALAGGGLRRAGVGAWLAAGIVGTAVSWIAFHAPLHYDTGLYHLQAIQWNQQAAVSPGLANLHDRFGLNSSWFVLASLTGLPGIGRAGVLLPCAMFTCCFFLAVLERARSSRAPGVALVYVLVVVLAFAAAWSFRPQSLLLLGLGTLGSPSTDLPVTLLVVYVSALCLESQAPADDDDLRLAVLLSSLAVTIKLSAVPLLLGVLAIGLGRSVAARRKALRSGLRFRDLTILTAFVLLPWAARGLVISGCLAYPISASCLTGLPWAVAAEHARIDSRLIAAWARNQPRPPDVMLASWDWLGPWWSRWSASGFVELFSAYVGLGGLLYLTARFVRRDRPLRAGPLWMTLAVNLAGLAFWFVTVPDPRFGLGYMLATCFLTLTLGLSALPRVPEIAMTRRNVMLVIALVAVTVRVAAQLGISRGGELGAPWPAFPPVGSAPARIASGQVVAIPAVLDQCWDMAIPCTPAYQFDPDLSMRVIGRRFFFRSPGHWPRGPGHLPPPDWTLPMGPSPWRPWAFLDGTWFAGCSESRPPGCLSGRFGQKGDLPVSGDWTGTGRTDIGVFRAGAWFLDDGNWQWDGTGRDRSFTFGRDGDVPVSGDWNGQGRTLPGVFRAGRWILDTNGNWQIDDHDQVVTFGEAGDIPVTGEWSRGSGTEIGVFRAGEWRLDANGNRRWDGPEQDMDCQFGRPGEVPIVADWDGTGLAKRGVVRDGAWRLDYNGNCRWDGPKGGDRVFYFGPPTAIAGTGRW